MDIFASADHHFGHKNIVKFTDAFGEKLRDFDTVEDMEEHIVEQHNSVVKPTDMTLFAGDVCFNKHKLELFKRMNGMKVLILGNHDQFSMKRYLEHFHEVCALKVIDNIIFTHIPLHPVSMGRWELNVHGHMHHNKIDHPKHLCVSMEQIDYKPISFEEIEAYVERNAE